MDRSEFNKVIEDAEKVILRGDATDSEIEAAVAKVDTLNDHRASLAIRRTLAHERRHKH